MKNQHSCPQCRTQLSRKYIDEGRGFIEFRWSCRMCHREYGKSWKSFTSWRDDWSTEPETTLTPSDLKIETRQKNILKSALEYLSLVLRIAYFTWKIFF